jgi:lysophospholipase L1-like esterase
MQGDLGETSISVTSWYYVTAVEALLSSEIGALVCVGDSITDGTGSTLNGNNRWVNDLFNRTQANSATRSITVLNAGIGGNHLAAGSGQGPDAVGRIGSIIAQPGVRYVTILDGVNDIRHTAATSAAQDQLYGELVAGLENIIDQVHGAGLPIFGATLTPFNDPPYSGYSSAYSNPIREATRNRLNNWIRNSAKFDYVVDYAAAVANKTDTNQYQDQYAFTNYIHPNVQGHQVMADAWDLNVFQRFSNGVSH